MIEKIRIWLAGILAQLLPDKLVLDFYKKAGTIMGATLSDMIPPMCGECYEIQELIDRKNFWERECVRRGYRTMSTVAFMNHGGWGRPLERFGEKV